MEKRSPSARAAVERKILGSRTQHGAHGKTNAAWARPSATGKPEPLYENLRMDVYERTLEQRFALLRGAFGAPWALSSHLFRALFSDDSKWLGFNAWARTCGAGVRGSGIRV